MKGRLARRVIFRKRPSNDIDLIRLCGFRNNSDGGGGESKHRILSLLSIRIYLEFIALFNIIFKRKSDKISKYNSSFWD